jgi:hypothetical protein
MFVNHLFAIVSVTILEAGQCTVFPAAKESVQSVKRTTQMSATLKPAKQELQSL